MSQSPLGRDGQEDPGAGEERRVGQGPEWQRLHPLSPLLRGGISLLAVGAWAISNQADRVFGGQSDLPEGTPPQLVAAGALAVVAGVLLLGWLSWRVSRYRIGETTLEVRTGLIFRQHRQVRYDRIQAVDIRRPLLARLAGLSEVRVQAAGGSGADARLAFLHQTHAQAVRLRLMALAGRTDETSATPVVSGGAPEGDASPGETVVRVPAVRLVQATLYRGQTLFLLGAVPALIASMAVGRTGMVAFLGPTVLALGGNLVGGLVRGWNFELMRDRDGIQIRRGLTELKSSSVPVHRIQVVSVRQSTLWRLPDWWRVEVNVAGVGPGTDDGDSVMLPVGTRAEALRVVALLRPETDPEPVLAGMVGDARGAGAHAGGVPVDARPAAYVVAPPRAVWLSPLVRSRHGYAVTSDVLLVRGGRASRFVHLVPHARIQSLRLGQGPLQRRLRLASVGLLSTPGRAAPQVEHLDQEDAEELLNAQVGRSSVAREPAW